MTPSRRRALTIAAIAIAALVVFRTDLVLAQPTPIAIVLLGLVIGGLNAMLGIGIILVYRTNRVINFAHGELGAFAGVLAIELNAAAGWNYFISIAVGLLTAMVSAAIVEVAIVRRFQNAPRLILTVATICVANVFVFLELIVPRFFPERVNSGAFRTPLSSWRFEIDPVIFDGNYVLVVVFVVLVITGLGAFLRSDYGIAVRASAENIERAALSGIPTTSLTTLIWVIAGLLSGAAAILQGPVIGLQVGVLIGPGLLLRALAAAVVGRMESLSITVAAAMGLAVLEQAVFWSYGRSTVIDATLLFVILAGLLLQRRRFSRVDAADATTWQAVSEVRPVPRELARLPEVRWGRIALGTVAALAVLVVPALFQSSRQNLSAVLVIYALIGVSLVVLTGWAGQVSLGQFALVGLGAASAGSLTSEAGWDFVLVLVVGGFAGMASAIVLGLPALRLRGFFLAVTTLAFAVTTSSYLLQLDWLVPDGLVGRPRLFGTFDLEDELTYYYVCLAVLAVAMVAVHGLRASRMGRAIVGIRDNERAAQSYGVNAIATKLTAFAISGFIAGVAGALLVHQQHGLPASQYAPQQSFAVFLLAVVGGLGSLPGAVLGALYIKGTQYLLQGPGAFFASGPGVLVLLLLVPGGLGALAFRGRDALLRVIARRRSIVVPSLLADVRDDAVGVDLDGEDPLGQRIPAKAPA